MIYGAPPNYNPHHPRMAQPEAPAVSEKQRQAAQRANAQYISPDGEQVCRRHYGGWIRADWRGDRYGAWSETDDYPDGWVKL